MFFIIDGNRRPYHVRFLSEQIISKSFKLEIFKKLNLPYINCDYAFICHCSTFNTAADMPD